MKLLIDCDDVFDRLTRGPFPAGHDDDAAVEAHLGVCHECRRLAEALRPAVNLLHEAYPHDADESLPAYHAPSTLPARAETSSSSFGWQLVAVALLGVVVSAMAMGSGWRGNRSTAAQPREAANVSGLAHLASLNLREVCLPSNNLLALGTERLRCCTDCHASSSPSKGIDVTRLQLACVSCHAPQAGRP